MPNEVQLNSANFQENISSYFQQLRHQPDFSDVTLVSEDKKWRSKERLDAPSICKCNVNVV